MRRCDVCGGMKFHPEQVEEIFHVDGQRILVQGIPAQICSRCGDAVFERETLEHVRLLVHGDQTPARQVSVDVFAYA